jgi:hypothetical protein
LTTPGFLGTVRGAHQNGDYECKTGVIVWFIYNITIFKNHTN